MSETTRASTICVMYGLNEGPGTGKQFEAACAKAGWRVVTDPAKADIIFAHSGGGLLIPPVNQAQTIIFVGVPYWPGRSWLLATVRKLWREGGLYRRQHQLGYWGRKWICYARYALNIRAGWRMLHNLQPTKPWNSAQRQIIVRNRWDTYCCPEVYQIDFKGPRSFISLPGEHDDCWDNPEPYVSLLQSERTIRSARAFRPNHPKTQPIIQKPGRLRAKPEYS